MDQNGRRKYLINGLLAEDRRFRRMGIPEEISGQKLLLRSLMNIRMPAPVSEEFLKVQDEYLKEETRLKGITDIDELEPVCILGRMADDGPAGGPECRADYGRLYVWQGDITTLKCDAIVNAANSGMTGCYVPNHRCIDNCIHTFAGMRLRQECARIMEEQGHEEPTGLAKLTPGYCLPCRFILHTVGPIISGNVTDRDCELLASCYLSCLELAAGSGIESVAFCCISTGEFHFPNELAAEIAVSTVRRFMTDRGRDPGSGAGSVRRVVFNVFKDYDREIYERLLGRLSGD